MIANEEEAAIGFSGRISRNGLLPWPEPVKKTVEGDDWRGAACVAGVALRGAGLGREPLFGPTALGEYAGGAFAGGSAFGAIGAVEPSLSGLASGLLESAKGWAVIAEDGPTGATGVGEASGRALRD